MRISLIVLMGITCLVIFPAISQEKQQPPTDPTTMLSQGSTKIAALPITDSIYWAEGFGNTFMVVTKEGNVIIDTSMPENAPRHKRLLRQINSQQIQYIILTHGHLDHRGGVAVWKEEQTEVIAHRNFLEFRNYQDRLAGFFTSRNNAQFNRDTHQDPDRQLRCGHRGNFAGGPEARL